MARVQCGVKHAILMSSDGASAGSFVTYLSQKGVIFSFSCFVFFVIIVYLIETQFITMAEHHSNATDIMLKEDVDKMKELLNVLQESIRRENMRQKLIRREIDFWEYDYDIQNDNFEKRINRLIERPDMKEIFRNQNKDLYYLQKTMDECCRVNYDLNFKLTQCKLRHDDMVKFNTMKINYVKEHFYFVNKDVNK